MAVSDVVLFADELLEVDGCGRALGCRAEAPRPDDFLEDGDYHMVECIRNMSPEARYEFGRSAREWMLANKTWKAQVSLIGSYIEKHVLKVNEK